MEENGRQRPNLARAEKISPAKRGGAFPVLPMGNRTRMATERQKAAARRNLEKARAAQAARRKGGKAPRQSSGLSTRDQNRLPDSAFAFPRERKEPLVDANHVRNAIARFGQVEGVSDRERDEAWKRIISAARKYDIEVSENSWRELKSA
jgi:hypothetical protein